MALSRHSLASRGSGILNPTVAQIFARHPVYDSLFSCLTPVSFARMSSLCREVREATIDYANRAYDIDRSLSHYFSDPVAFRKLMARTYLLISGSFALQFFKRTSFSGSDLDLFVHHDIYGHDDSGRERILEIGRWLEGEGYMFKPSPGQGSTLDGEVQELEVVDAMLQRYGEGLAVADVYTFERSPQNHVGTDTVRKVQLVIPSSKHSSPLETILNFHSTCVINVIAHDAAYSLYPYATFELNSALVLTRDGSARTKAALKKYASRGFRMLDPRSPSPTYDAQEVARFFVGRHRRVDDRHSWIIPFKKLSHKQSQLSSLERGNVAHHQGGDHDGRIQTVRDETMGRHRRNNSKYAVSDDEDSEEEYDSESEDYEDDEEQYDEDEGEEEDGDIDWDPIPECRWRLCGDTLPLRVAGVDYVGAREMFSDEY